MVLPTASSPVDSQQQQQQFIASSIELDPAPSSVDGHLVIEISDDDSETSNISVVPVKKRQRHSRHPLSMEKAAVNESFSETVLVDVFSSRKRIFHVKIPAALSGVLIEMRIAFERDYPISIPEVLEYTGGNRRLTTMGNLIFRDIWKAGKLCLLDFFIKLVTKIKEDRLELPLKTVEKQCNTNSDKPSASQQKPTNREAAKDYGKPGSKRLPFPVRLSADPRTKKIEMRKALKQANDPFNWLLYANFGNFRDLVKLSVDDLAAIRGLKDYPPPIPALKNTKHQELALVSRTYNPVNNNERLEFFGDRICAQFMAEMLIQNYGLHTHHLTMILQKCLTNLQFGIFNSLYGLQDRILRAPGVPTVKERGDAWEAMIGALYLDCENNVDDKRRLYRWWVELLTPWANLYISKLVSGRNENTNLDPPPSVPISPSNQPMLPATSRLALLGESSGQARTDMQIRPDRYRPPIVPIGQLQADRYRP
ncbi:hypothetical protein RUND412_008378 [Rhizina undulata]